MANNLPINNMLKSLRLFGFIAILAVAMVTVTSCGKEKKIVGKWKCTSVRGEGWYGMIWKFKDNGEFIWQEDEGEDDYGEWSISKDELRIEVGDIIGEFDIDELTSREMSISGEWTEINTRTGEVRERFSSSYDFKKK